MKAYICLPAKYYEETDLEKLKKLLHQNIDKFFFYYELEVCRGNDLKVPQVIFMGDTKSSSAKDEAILTITTLFRAFYKDDNLDIDIKINYSKFNPNFYPLTSQDSEQDSSRKNKKNGEATPSSEFDYEKLSLNYTAIEPRYSFDQVVLPKKVVEEIDNAIGIINVEHKVFDEWGLRSIIPEIGTALNFYGAPGTGKSMTAEAVAHKLGKKIIKATYADIESKYIGEGPKMVKAIFKAAEREDAVLFLDEADSLLSKRLTDVSEGSGQAINSMRSQLLISLENHTGLVIFASNLVINYDKAFLSRLINIEFTNPTKEEREGIWNNHLKTEKVQIPLSSDVSISYLAEKYDFCGREIKNSVKDACVRAALNGQDYVSQADFVYACDKNLEEKNKVINSIDHTRNDSVKLTPSQQEALKESLQDQLNKKWSLNIFCLNFN